MSYKSLSEIQNQGESVKVCLRIRPMNKLELSRNDDSCVKVLNSQICEIK